MKIYLPWGGKSKTGKQKYIKLFGEELERMSHEVVSNFKKGCDVYFDFNSFKRDPVDAIKILRIGPFEDVHVEEMQESIYKADAYSFESEWAKNNFKKYFELKKPYIVVYNCEKTETGKIWYHKDIMAITDGRIVKNLTGIVATILQMPYTVLHVYGNIETDKVMHPRIIYHGRVERDVIREKAQECACGVHICPIDCCPNSVVEMLSVGCPVVCGNTGGTPELIKEGCGETVDIYPADVGHKPPPIDCRLLADALSRCSKHDRVKNNKHIDVKNFAKKHLELIEELNT